MPSNYPRPHAVIQQLLERASEYIMTSYPVRDAPLNLRPAIVFILAFWLLLLGILGFAPLPTLPINDKALHFFGMGFATFLLYFVIEVQEGPHRRIWYWRRAPLLITLFLGFFCGGIVSEIIQSTLPWKEFQFGDIVANILGSLTFLYLAHIVHKRARRRDEIAQLYQPLTAHEGARYRDAQGRTHTFAPAADPGGAGQVAVSGEGTDRDLPPAAEYDIDRHDVWDDELDEEELIASSVSRTVAAPRSANQVFALDDDDGDDDQHSRHELA